MSVTIADCLELPSLRDAAVAGGASGLNKIVATVTVLEYTDISLLKDDVFAGNEIVITAFGMVKDNVDMQCNLLRHTYNKGCVALILYSLEVIVPKLSKKLVDVADELGMPLITLPPKNTKYRYADAIFEIVEAIIYDQLHENYFVPTIIERVAQFPESQRNIGNVLRILSDRFHTTIILTDEQMQLVGHATWPITDSFDFDYLVECFMKEMIQCSKGIITDIVIGNSTMSTYYSPIYMGKNQKMYMFVMTETKEPSYKTLDKNTLRQISESIQLIISLNNYSDWSRCPSQMVNAIMNNDTYRINLIAAQACIDIKSFHEMWILIMPKVSDAERTELFTTSRMLQFKEYLSDRYKLVFSGIYEDSIILLMGDPLETEIQETALFDSMAELCLGDDAVLISFSDLTTYTDMRKAYEVAQEGWFALRAIYKYRSVFFQQELNFALSCRQLIQVKNEYNKDHTAILNPLLSSNNASESIDTLSVFLLDASSSITKTAKLMHIHPSTVKYRLKEIKKKLKIDLVKLPDAYKLYLAVAILRLVAVS